METKLLVVEDEARTRASIQEALSSRGYRVLGTDLIRSAWHIFCTERPELAIIDVGLPDGSGLDLCRRIRDNKEHGSIPIIILTAKAEFEDKSSGFQSGADQYLVKPVAPRELLLWVEALLRRLSLDKEEGDVLRSGDCEIDLSARLVRFSGQVVYSLTGKEFDLFYFLVKKRPQIISRRHILSRLWHTIAVEHVVDTHIYNLRRKLPPPLADKIQTVPGKGFRYLE